jgi:hypothetical protein
MTHPVEVEQLHLKQFFFEVPNTHLFFFPGKNKVVLVYGSMCRSLNKEHLQ